MAYNAAHPPANQGIAIPATGGRTLMVALIALAAVAFVTLLVAYSPTPTEPTAAADIWRGNGAKLSSANPAPGAVPFK